MAWNNTHTSTMLVLVSSQEREWATDSSVDRLLRLGCVLITYSLQASTSSFTCTTTRQAINDRWNDLQEKGERGNYKGDWRFLKYIFYTCWMLCSTGFCVYKAFAWAQVPSSTIKADPSLLPIGTRGSDWRSVAITGYQHGRILASDIMEVYRSFLGRVCSC